ncbi:MAG: hypothetical protein AABY22_33475 [Nanoarchaeota archaeon]
MVEYKKIKGSILLVKSNVRQELGQIFLRLQNFVDSNKFRNRSFTLDEFSKWYYKEKKSSYINDFKGFNIPSSFFINFFCGQFDPVSKEEAYLKEKVSQFSMGVDHPYYIIGYLNNSGDTMEHELVHALYYLSRGYRGQHNELIYSLKKSLNEEEIVNWKKFFNKFSYHQEIWDEEMGAYIIADKTTLIKNNLYTPTDFRHGAKLKNIFKNSFLFHFGVTASKVINQNKSS